VLSKALIKSNFSTEGILMSERSELKEYSKSYSISQDSWAKIVSDTMRVDRKKNPALMVVLGSKHKKVRLAIIEWEVFEQLREKE
jgi:hypothetical protein